MNKTELRKLILEKREALSSEQRCALLQQVIDHLNEFDFTNIKVVHIYLPIKKKNEIDTFPIIRFLKLIAPTIKIVIPKSDFDSFDMINVLYDDNTILTENEYNIWEPVNGDVIENDKIDMVICPLLSFDKRGYRVGYGKGFYDRFLNKCREDVVKIGLSYFEPEEIIEDVNELDVSLNFAISPSRLWKF